MCASYVSISWKLDRLTLTDSTVIQTYWQRTRDDRSHTRAHMYDHMQLYMCTCSCTGRERTAPLGARTGPAPIRARRARSARPARSLRACALPRRGLQPHAQRAAAGPSARADGGFVGGAAAAAALLLAPQPAEKSPAARAEEVVGLQREEDVHGRR